MNSETTGEAITRLLGRGRHVGCLNFASAKYAGGGFLTGAQAQEEALACSSTLHPCLLKAPQYYAQNRAHRSTIYLDLIIHSPLVPFFRNDEGVLLEQPVLASVMTVPAPNAGAVMQNEPILTLGFQLGGGNLNFPAWQPLKTMRNMSRILSLGPMKKDNRSCRPAATKSGANLT